MGALRATPWRQRVSRREDWDFWIAASGLGYFGTLLPRVLFMYRLHGDGLMKSDVMVNFPERFRQIVLNTAALYPPPMVRQAANGEPVDRVIA